MTAEGLWKLLQKSLRENDKMTIVKMITFPMEFAGELNYRGSRPACPAIAPAMVDGRGAAAVHAPSGVPDREQPLPTASVV